MLVGLVPIEIAIRAMLAFRYGESLSDGMPRTDDLGKWTQHWLGTMIEPVDNANLVYALLPGVEGRFMKLPVRTNSRGFRDDEVMEWKQPGLRRVVALGDSTTFGWGVHSEATYTSLLERAIGLLVEHPSAIEVVNMGTPGYNAIQEVELFHVKGLDLKPDVVTIQFDLGDALVPIFLFDTDFRALDRLYVARLPGALVARFIKKEKESILMSFVDAGHEPPGGGPFVMDPKGVPRRFRHLVGWKGVVGAYRRLKETCDGLGIPLIAVIPAHSVYEDQPLDADPAYDVFRDLCNELSIPFVDTFETTRDFALRYGLTTPDLALDAPIDMHPDNIRNALMALSIFDPLIESLGIEGVPPGLRAGARDYIESKIRRELELRGLHDTEDWDGTPVHWTRKECKLIVKPVGGPIKVNFLVGHRDLSEENPLEVTVTIPGVTSRTGRYASKGYQSMELEIPDPAPDWIGLVIEVDRTFKESEPGRDLGVALYPIEGIVS